MKSKLEYENLQICRSSTKRFPNVILNTKIKNLLYKEGFENKVD
jgi:hypothetical protein